MDFARIIAADFEIAFVAFLLTFQLAIDTFLSILSSKLIVESFWESIIFGWSIGIWFRKLPKKPPDKCCSSNSCSNSIVSALISWLLCVSHPLSLNQAFIISNQFHWTHSRCAPVWNVYKRTNFTLPNAPWEHHGLHASSSGNVEDGAMHTENICWQLTHERFPARQSPTQVMSSDFYSAGFNRRMDSPRTSANKGERQEAWETREKGQSNTIIYTSTDTNKQTAAIAIAIAINWSSHGLRRPHSTTSDPTYFKDRIDVTRYRGHIKARHHFHIIILPLPRVPQIALFFWIEFECAAHIDDGRWTMEQCHTSSSAGNYSKNNKNTGLPIVIGHEPGFWYPISRSWFITEFTWYFSNSWLQFGINIQSQVSEGVWE